MVVDLTKEWYDQTSWVTPQVEGVSDTFMNEVTFQEITMMESLLSPSIETTYQMQAPIHEGDGVSFKNWDEFKGARITLKYTNPNITTDPFQFTQMIYRMENRQNMKEGVETFMLRSCDQTVINNQRRRMAKQYDCETPSTVVVDALHCIGAGGDVEEANPTRRYIAENLHPFQVIADQADVALSSTNDPSFVHYMTYEDGGKHNFRSISGLVKQPTVWNYTQADAGFGDFVLNPYNILSYEFPCDFDLLTDILNGINDDGSVSASLTAVNTWTGQGHVVDGDLTACGGMGEALNAENESDDSTDNGCGVQVEKYHLKRMARIALIQPDKIALRMVVPFNPKLHSGNMITATFPVRPLPGQVATAEDYGSGDYMIVSLKHVLGFNGNGITIIDAVSESVGQGIV